MATDIVLNKVILSYPHLVQPWAGQPGQEPKYGCAMILPKDFGQWGDVQTCAKNAILEKFGGSPPENLKMPWLNQYLQPKTVKEGIYEGFYTMSANSDRKPQLVDENVNEVNDMLAKERFFAGALVNVYVGFFGYDVSGNKGISMGLRMVQLVDRHMPRLDGGTKDPKDVFEKIAGAPAPTAPPPGEIPW